ncbi:hypothetical protein HanIR_Chr09g0440331 [Helianthus annuus]|nr:hypothetical protein HanIR_Chr09g0440331 [Helianthus annuus]
MRNKISYADARSASFTFPNMNMNLLSLLNSGHKCANVVQCFFYQQQELRYP